MPLKRSYADQGDACATSHAMELLGDRWTYPVLRELMLAPKRFGELVPSVRGITPAVLTARLRELERTGLLRRALLPPPAAVAVYELTPWALELIPIFQSLGRWALGSPTRSLDGCGLTPDSTVQSMLTMAPPHAVSPPVELTLHLHDGRLDDEVGYRYRLRWGRRLEVTRDDGSGVTASRSAAATSVRADSSTWASVLYDGLSLDEVRIDGSRQDVVRLVSAFATSEGRA